MVPVLKSVSKVFKDFHNVFHLKIFMTFELLNLIFY